MNKSDKTDDFFRAKIQNIISIAENQGYPKFSSFLDEVQQRTATEVLRLCHCNNYRFFGGLDECGRKMLGIAPDYMEAEDLDFPISVLEVRFHKDYQLSHRDFLGSLMALQIKREKVGDILVSEGLAVIFVQEDLKDFVIQNIEKIGRVGVALREVTESPIRPVQEFKEISGTVASLRIDCILALITRLSRTKAAELISSGRVMVQYAEVDSANLIVKPGDVVSVRGYGKFILLDEIHETKKGRFHIKINQYV